MRPGTAAGRTRTPAAAMDDQAPRSRCETAGTGRRDRGHAGRRGRRRYQVVFAVVGGLLGPGYWLCGVLWDGRPFGSSPAEVHFTEFVLALVVVVVASWGLLLILGEALLFSLAIFRAYDKEQYDVYRNLMILWGYVLTLGIPRHFRKLPAQFGGLGDDARDGSRGAHRDGGRRGDRGPNARDQRRPREAGEAGEARRRSGEDPRERTGCQDRALDRVHDRAHDRGGPWDHEDVRDHVPCRKRANPTRRRPEDDRERDARPPRRRAEETDPARPEREDEREAARAGRVDRREAARPGRGEETEAARPGHADGRETARSGRADEGEAARPGRADGREAALPGRGDERDARRRRSDGRRVGAVPERDGARGRPPSRDRVRRPVDPEVTPERPGKPQKPEKPQKRHKPVAALEPTANPLGPIFPPRPAAEDEAPPVVPVAPVTPVAPPSPYGGGFSALTTPAVAASLADAIAIAGTIPDASAELRDALGLLLRYAVGLDAERPPPQQPGGTFGIAAETGGDP